jgi:hypothetical protein
VRERESRMGEMEEEVDRETVRWSKGLGAQSRGRNGGVTARCNRAIDGGGTLGMTGGVALAHSSVGGVRWRWVGSDLAAG